MVFKDFARINIVYSEVQSVDSSIIGTKKDLRDHLVQCPLEYSASL